MHAAMMGTDLEPKQLTEPPITKEKFMEVFKFQMATMKKYTPKMQAMQIQAMQGGQQDQRGMIILQAQMQDEVYEATGLEDEDFQAAMGYWSQNDAEVAAMVAKLQQEMGMMAM